MRMNAYYYYFERTGVKEVDFILTAVAQAGKEYHSTEDWNNTDNSGFSPVGKIQAAADQAALSFQIANGQEVVMGIQFTNKKEREVIIPAELTAENGAKGLLSGEFFVAKAVECPFCDDGQISHFNNEDFDECEFCDGVGENIIDIAVDWTTIKKIYAKAVEHLGEKL